MAVAPLRIGTIVALKGEYFHRTFAEDGTHYYYLRIPRSHFKNRRYLEGDFELRLPSRITELFDMYCSRAWPILNLEPGRISQLSAAELREVLDATAPQRAHETESTPLDLPIFSAESRLFTSWFAERGVSETKKVTGPQRPKGSYNWLRNACFRASRKFLGQKYATRGFFLHAFRHIVATAEVKATGGYDSAAKLLWEKSSTVESTYAHVKEKELLARASAKQHARYDALRAKHRDAA
jgi:hypothetical protein